MGKAGMRRALGAMALAAVVAGCSTDTPAPPPAAPVARPAAPAPAPAPTRPVTSNDQCGLRQAQALVGRPRSEIPVPLDPALQRVACTTCPVTLDFNPRRLNFFFDADSGVIKEVRCG